MGTYSTLRLWARHGHAIAFLCGVFVALASVTAALLADPLWLVPGLPGAVLAWLLLASYADVAQMLIDMLLPAPDLS